jgi:hypothetical protein
MSEPKTLEQVAALLRKGPRWLKDWLRNNPDCFYKAGRTRLFDDADIERIKARLREEHEQKHRFVLGRRGTRYGSISDEAVNRALIAARGQPQKRRPKTKEELETEVLMMFKPKPTSYLPTWEKRLKYLEGFPPSPKRDEMIAEARKLIAEKRARKKSPMTE